MPLRRSQSSASCQPQSPARRRQSSSTSNPNAESTSGLDQLLNDPSYISRIRTSHASAPLSEAETSIRDNSLRMLRRAYRQVTTSLQSDWPFNSPDSLFHHHPSRTPSFSNALALTNCSESLLLAPVRIHNERVLGYSFGSRLSSPNHFSSDTGLFGHSVGRFSYHMSSGDLLIVVFSRREVFICNIKVDSTNRERSRRSFVLRRGNEIALPENDIIAMTEAIERRIRYTTQFQFIHPNTQLQSRTQMQTAMISLERQMRGRFVSDATVHDTLDERTGRLTERRTGPESSEFGLPDAIEIRVSRDMAVRRYFSFASSSTQNVDSSEQRRTTGPRERNAFTRAPTSR